jgi:hypothetical protein
LLGRWEAASLEEIARVFKELNGWCPIPKAIDKPEHTPKSWYEERFRRMGEEGTRLVRLVSGPRSAHYRYCYRHWSVVGDGEATSERAAGAPSVGGEAQDEEEPEMTESADEKMMQLTKDMGADQPAGRGLPRGREGKAEESSLHVTGEELEERGVSNEEEAVEKVLTRGELRGTSEQVHGTEIGKKNGTERKEDTDADELEGVADGKATEPIVSEGAETLIEPVNLLDFFPEESGKEVRPLADGTERQKLGAGNGGKRTAKRTRIPIGMPGDVEGAAVTSAEQASTVIRGLLARWESVELGEINAVFERLNGFVPLRNDTSAKRLDAKSWFEMLFRKMLEQGKRYVGRGVEGKGSKVLKLKPWPDSERPGRDAHVARPQRGSVQSGREAVLALAPRFPAGPSEKSEPFKDSTGSMKAPVTRNGKRKSKKWKRPVPSDEIGNPKRRKRDGEDDFRGRQKDLRRGAATLKEQKGSQRIRERLAEKIRRCGQQGFIPEHEGGLDTPVTFKSKKRDFLQKGGVQENVEPTSSGAPKGGQLEKEIEGELGDEDAEGLNEDDFLQFCLEEGVSEAQGQGTGFGGLDTTFLQGRDEKKCNPGESGLKGAARESVEFCRLVEGELGEEAPLVEHHLVIPKTSFFQTSPDAGDVNPFAPDGELSELKDEPTSRAGQEENERTSRQQTTDFECEKRRSGGELVAPLYPELGLAGEFLVAPETGDCETEPEGKEGNVNSGKEDGVHGETGKEGEETERKEPQIPVADFPSGGFNERGEVDLGDPSKLSPDIRLAPGDSEGPVAAATAMEPLTRCQKGSVEGGKESRLGESDNTGGGESVGVGNGEELGSGLGVTGGTLERKGSFGQVVRRRPRQKKGRLLCSRRRINLEPAKARSPTPDQRQGDRFQSARRNPSDQ